MVGKESNSSNNNIAIKANENGLVGINLLAILNAIVAGKKMQKYKNVKQLKKLNLLFIVFQSLTIFIFQETSNK